MKKRKFLLTLSLVIFLSFSPVQENHAADVASWVGAGLCSLLYTPLKAGFAILMGVTGGLSMIATVPAGDTDVSTQIVKWGIYGDWLIRPDHLYGQTPVKLIGTEDVARFVQRSPDSRIAERD